MENVRVALISDIHGNGVALEAALRDLSQHSADQVVCLGDAVQGGSDPAGVLQMLKELKSPVIMGNADSWILSGESTEQTSPAMLEIRDWTREQLGDEGISFVSAFEPRFKMDLGNERTLLCFHGSPNSFDDVILPETPDDETRQFFEGWDASIFAGGHTHLQWVKNMDGSILLNPGSVGLAYSRYLSRENFYIYPVAEYAIVQATDRDLSIEFCRVPFDVDELDRVARASGRPGADGEAARYRAP